MQSLRTKSDDVNPSCKEVHVHLQHSGPTLRSPVRPQGRVLRGQAMEIKPALAGEPTHDEIEEVGGWVVEYAPDQMAQGAHLCSQ